MVKPSQLSVESIQQDGAAQQQHLHVPAQRAAFPREISTSLSPTSGNMKSFASSPRNLNSASSWRTTRRKHFGGRQLPLVFCTGALDVMTRSSALASELYIYVVFIISFSIFAFIGRRIELSNWFHGAVQYDVLDKIFPTVTTEVELLKSQLTVLSANSNSSSNTTSGFGDDVWLPQEKVYEGATSAAWLQLWFQDVYLPHVLRVSTRTNNATDVIQVSDTRIRFMTLQSESCKQQHNNKDNLQCYGKHKKEKEETRKKPGCDGFVYVDCSASYIVAETGVYHCGGYTATLPSNATAEKLTQRFNQLVAPTSSSSCITNNNYDSLRFIALERVVYSIGIDTHMSEKLYIEVTPTGKWLPAYEVLVFDVFTSDRVYFLLFSVYFFLFVVYYMCRFGLDWHDDVVSSDKLFHFLFSFWNLFELCNLLCFIVAFVAYFSWISQSLSSYPENTDDIISFYTLQVFVNSVNTVFTFLKLLRFLQLNNRLNILSRTMSSCGGSIIGIIVLFLFFIFGYAITGHSLYGSTVREFRTVNAAFSALMQVMLGQINPLYDKMSASAVSLTVAYFWTFEIISQFLLLNFIIAVLSNSLGDVNKATPLLPISGVVTRWLKELKYTFSFDNILRRWNWWRKGLSKHIILKQMHAELLGHSNMIPKYELRNHMLLRDDLNYLLTVALKEAAGEYTLDIVWEDLVYEYDLLSRTEIAVERRNWDEVAVEASLPTLQRFLNIMTDLNDRFDEVEDLCERISRKHRGM